MRFGSVYLSLLVLFAAGPCLAQSQDPGSGSSSTAKPASPAADTSSSTSPEKKKTKKVWTNDEIGSVGGTISVVGDAKSSTNAVSSKKGESSGGANDARQQQIENYRNQIQQIQAQIEAIDKRIAQLKNFKAENTSPSGGINLNQGYNMVPIEDQVKELEDKKKQLEAKIDDIESEAHKNGIDSGDLR